MASFNRVIMVGNLTRDPELRQLPSGQTMCRFSLASNRQYRSKQSGEMTQEVCFIDVDVWGAQAESCYKYLSKGRPALVEGRLKFDSWQASDGASRSKHVIVAERVVFLGSAQAGAEQGIDEQQEQALKNGAQEQNFERAQQVAAGQQAADAQEFTPAHKETGAHKGRKKKDTDAPADETPVFQDEPPFQDDLPY